jgi:hypothetical protein
MSTQIHYGGHEVQKYFMMVAMAAYLLYKEGS